jgi:hypothetical protein
MDQVRFEAPRISIPAHGDEQAVFFTGCNSDTGVPYLENPGQCIINELELNQGNTLHVSMAYTPSIYNFPETVFNVINHEIDGLTMDKCDFRIDVSGGIPLPYPITPTPTGIPQSSPTSAPVSSFTSTNSTTEASSGTVVSCSAAKPGNAPVLISAMSGKNGIVLTWSKAANPVTRYLIAYGTSSDTMQYGNPDAGGPETTSYTVKSLSGGTTYYFRVKAINDCMPGDFSNVMSAVSTGTQKNTTSPATGFALKSEIPGNLFDIVLSLESAVLFKSGDLVARTQFTSFGKIPTPVAMIYRVVDADNRQVYTEMSNVTVETEQLVIKEFKNLKLGSGKYSLILSTTYGKDVKDEFRQAFEVKGTSGFSSVVLTIMTHILAAVTGGLVIYRFIRRKPKKKGRR